MKSAIIIAGTILGVASMLASRRRTLNDDQPRTITAVLTLLGAILAGAMIAKGIS